MIAQIPDTDEGPRRGSAGTCAPLLLITEGVPVEWGGTIGCDCIASSEVISPAPARRIGLAVSREGPGEETLPGHDFTNGWRNLFARGLEIVESPGDHFSMTVG